MTSWLVVSHQRRWFLWIGVNLFLVYKLRNAPPFVAEISLEHLWSRLPAKGFTLSSGNPRLIPHHLKAWSRWATTNRISIQASWICEARCRLEIPRAVLICCVYILMFVFGNFYVFLNISYNMFMQMNTEHARRCQTKRIKWKLALLCPSITDITVCCIISQICNIKTAKHSKALVSHVTSTLKLGNCNLVLQS